MDLFGYLLSICIGIILGLIGGGGSILTIPVLVYFFKVEPVLAGAYSLFVVGVSSMIGVVSKSSRRLVDLRTAIIFGLPSLAAVFITRHYLLPVIPEVLFEAGGITVSRSGLMMILFALLMMAASRPMIVARPATRDAMAEKSSQGAWLALQGVLIGIVTGFLGAGGGFLIIPALVMLARLPMKAAVSNSLLIIAVNSMVGFFGNWSAEGAAVNWSFLLAITGLAILGILIGGRLGKHIEGSKLKRGFGWFILAMGIIILLAEIPSFAN
jgi:uncharacterized protein